MGDDARSKEPTTDSLDDLRRYYETEAELRRRGPVRAGLRRQVRARFLELLEAEGRQSVLDLGAGPGRDGGAFVAAGHHHVGLDLALGNGRLAAEAGLAVVQASILAAPIRPRSFAAGWSMSTLMHLAGSEVEVALDELVGALRPGSPAVLGQWGREQEEVLLVSDELPGARRRFCLRSFDHNRRLVAGRGEIESADRLERLSGDWDYVFQFRTPA